MSEYRFIIITIYNTFISRDAHESTAYYACGCACNMHWCNKLSEVKIKL